MSKEHFIFSSTYRVFIKYCVFEDIKLYSRLWFQQCSYWPFMAAFPRCQCVYTHKAGRTPALQQNWQSSENSKRKNTIFNEQPVCYVSPVRGLFYLLQGL